MRRPVRFLLMLLLVWPILAAIAGWIVAPWFLHPVRRALTADLIHNADVAFAQIHATREDFNLKAQAQPFADGKSARRYQTAIGFCFSTESETIASAFLIMRSSCFRLDSTSR